MFFVQKFEGRRLTLKEIERTVLPRYRTPVSVYQIKTMNSRTFNIIVAQHLRFERTGSFMIRETRRATTKDYLKQQARQQPFQPVIKTSSTFTYYVVDKPDTHNPYEVLILQ